VTFTLDTTGLQGKSVVVFESLEYQGVEIAAHADIDDKGQTVTVSDIQIGTSANGKDGSKTIPVDKWAVVVDVVTYSGLTVGETYVMNGTLMDKVTGEPLLIGGKEVTALTTFTPEAASGSVEVTFTFETTALAGKTLVVFESLVCQGVEIAAHNDLNDKGQTVTVDSPTPGGSPKTGDGSNPGLWTALAGIAVIGLGCLGAYGIRRWAKKGRGR